MTRLAHRTIAYALTIAMVAGVLTVWAAPAKAWVSGNLWDPGYIISNQEFYDGDAMSASQIQTFLNAQVPTCHPEWSSGPDDPIVCLKDYRQTTVSRAADAYCPNAYVGASNETAATIIAKVAQACNISPKVLLVTLQKEQGLVTHTWPSARRYEIAMGYGCPDTGSCMSEYYGFQNQVWRAARQFQRYTQLPTSYNYRAGVNNQIGYHPNVSCGAQTVYIQNSATAALYNYTPYVPNSAALNAIPGTGDSCSSYGNRNFFMYYWEWFGSPVAATGTKPIQDAYAAQGGAAGPLGTLISAPTCAVDAPCVWVYQHGGIAWTKPLGAIVTSGIIGDSWLANREAYGKPTAAQTVVSDPNGNGYAQAFERGVVHSSNLGTFLVTTGTMPAYSAAGWLRGDIGWPTSDPLCGGSARGCVQTFQGGMASVNSAGAGTFMRADVAALYVANGAQGGAFGYPSATQTSVVDPNGNGVVQAFDKGVVHASDRGAFLVPSNVMTGYSAAGWLRGSLGWPVTGYTCGAVECLQAFAGGVIRTSLDGISVSVAAVHPAVRDAYQVAGGSAGSLGHPLATATVVTDRNGNGVVQAFAGGVIHAGPSGAFVVPNGIMPVYSGAGWLRGSLGWPVSAQVCGSSGCVQTFAGGEIRTAVDGSGAFVSPVVDPAVKTAHDAAGGAAGPLGYPVAKASIVIDKNGNGVVQAFQGGLIHAGPSGAYAVPTAVMPAYSAAGWLRGALGWPSGAAVCGAAGCSQGFVGGTIVVPSGQSGFVIAPIAAGPILNLYNSSGGASGPLGYPTASETVITDKNGSGRAQAFEKGVVHSSAAGAFLVPSSLMPVYSANGWLRGSLGWPVAAATCDSSGCAQDFAGGTILVPTGQAGFVVAPIVSPAIRDLYDSSGGATGALGYPTAIQTVVSDPNGNGLAQAFEKGVVHSSAAGTFLVPTSAMPAYSARGWVRGALGWPSGAAVCDAGGCVQQFQRGTIDTHS